MNRTRDLGGETPKLGSSGLVSSAFKIHRRLAGPPGINVDAAASCELRSTSAAPGAFAPTARRCKAVSAVGSITAASN